MCIITTVKAKVCLHFMARLSNGWFHRGYILWYVSKHKENWVRNLSNNVARDKVREFWWFYEMQIEETRSKGKYTVSDYFTKCGSEVCVFSLHLALAYKCYIITMITTTTTTTMIIVMIMKAFSSSAKTPSIARLWARRYAGNSTALQGRLAVHGTGV